MKKLIDPLGIFQEIKDHVIAIYPDVQVTAFGSRAKGVSYTHKWDFDVLIYDAKGEVSIPKLNHSLSIYFRGRKDENNKDVKVDLFRTKSSDKEKLNKAGFNGYLL